MTKIEELEKEWKKLFLLYMKKREKFREHAKLLGELRNGFSQTPEFKEHDRMAREIVTILSEMGKISRKIGVNKEV